MRKIPVWRTIGFAYAFAFSNLATIIGLIWLPLTAMFAGEYFAVQHYFASVAAALTSGNRFAIYGASGYLYVFRLAVLLLQAVIAAPLMRQALGLRTKGAFVHFALGPAEICVLGASVACELVLVVIDILALMAWRMLLAGFTMAAGTVGTIDGHPARTILLWPLIALTLLLLGGVIFIAIRLSFLLVAVTVAEKRVDLVRGWTLTHGNFWRALWIVTCVGLPVWLLYAAVQFAIVGIVGRQAPDFTVPTLGQFASSAQLARLQMHLLLDRLPWFFGVWFALRPLVLGLASGAAAAAYRALVPVTETLSTPAPDGLLSAAAV